MSNTATGRYRRQNLFAILERWEFVMLIAVVAQTMRCQAQALDPQLINAQTNAQVLSQITGTPGAEPVVLRLDMLADELALTASEGIDDPNQQIAFVQNGLSVTSIWPDVLFDPIAQEWDLSIFAASLLGLLPGDFGIDPYPDFLESREAALAEWEVEDRDVTNEIQAYYDQVLDRYQTGDATLPSPELDFAPVYQVTYGYSDATNAKVVGLLPSGSGNPEEFRCTILLNLGAREMLREAYFAIASIHETWHCFHSRADVSPNDLLKRTLREGLVTYLSEVVMESMPELSYSQEDIFFWSFDELEAAQSNEAAILEAFAAVRTETEGLQEWLVLGRPLSTVAGAPSRSAYYIGYLAIATYVDEKERTLSSPSFAKDLVDMVDTPEGREEIFQTLLQKASENTLAPNPTPTIESAASKALGILLPLYTGLIYYGL